MTKAAWDDFVESIVRMRAVFTQEEASDQENPTLAEGLPEDTAQEDG
jgi:hypothetical protein